MNNNLFSSGGSVPNNLETIIRKSGMNKRQVAQARGVTPETLSRHIHGHINMTITDAEEYAKVLGCNAQQIMFLAAPIDIIANCHIHTNNIIDRNFVERPAQQVFMPDYYLDNAFAIQWTTDDEYQGMWFEWANAIQFVLKDPIVNSYVHKECVQQVSLVKFAEPCHCERTDRILTHTSGILYPAPGNRYTIWSSASGSSMENVKLEWAAPQVQAVFRPDLRGVSIVDIES